MTGVLLKRRNLDTDTHTGKTPCEHEDRDGGNASTSQEITKIASKVPKASGKAQNRFSLPLSEEIDPVYTLILDF